MLREGRSLWRSAGDGSTRRPARLAPHHTSAERDGDVVRLRVLFAVESTDEPEVRRRIAEALAAGHVVTPGGGEARWLVTSEGPDDVRPEESDHGHRLALPQT